MADYIIITAPDCNWCDKAKALIKKKGLASVEFSTTEPTVRHLFFSFNVKTVPQIFISASGNRPIQYIGGYEDLERHFYNPEY